MARKVGRIRDVARESGLSIATISRVMNGAPNVSETTRARVLEACRKLDYLPNPAARALSTAKSRTIAAIIPTIEHSIFAKYIAAIERTLSDSGYSLVLAISNSDDDSELKAARKLLGMGAQAFILSGAAHRPELAELFDRRGVPFVFTSIWDEKSKVPTIGYDNTALANRAVTYLLEKGHRDIAVLHGSIIESDRTRARLEGAKRADSGSLQLSFYECSLDVAGGRQAVEAMIEAGKSMTALLCFSDVLALGAYFGLQNRGLSVPSDVSVMGFDNLDWSQAALPGLTTIDLPAAAMGENVALQLMGHLEDGTPISPSKLDAMIIERESVLSKASGATVDRP